MNRLTQKDDQGNWSLRGVKWEQLYAGQIINCKVYELLYGAIWKLMEYEDTGLTPDRIQELNGLYREKCQEANMLRDQQRWIPVGERLPEISIPVWVTRKLSTGNHVSDDT